MRAKTFKNKCMVKCLNRKKKKENAAQILLAHKGKCISGKGIPITKCFVIYWKEYKLYRCQDKLYKNSYWNGLLEYAIPQKDHIGSNTQIAIQGVDAEENASKQKHKKIKSRISMTSDERKLLEYEDSVKNITKYLGWILISHM